MECVLHGIDIGHPTFSWEEECRWARLVATEFQAQVRLRINASVSLCAGDGLNILCAFLAYAQFREQVNREEAVSLPTTDFLRCTGEQNLGKGQVGFFQFFVWPYFKELEKHIPELNTPTAQITVNKDRFKRVGDGEEQMVPVRTRSIAFAAALGVKSVPNIPLRLLLLLLLLRDRCQLATSR